MEKMRLSKLLAGAGVASRRACEELIFAGKVTVNGEEVLIPQTMVTFNDDVRVDDEPVRRFQPKVYFLLNKPVGYICSNKAIGTKKLVIDLFPPDLRLFTVGRLDRDTSGLLIVTNDGHFAQKVIHPSANITKEYLVKTLQEVDHEHLTEISQGTVVEGVFVRPVKVTKVRRGTIKVAVKEGRKREVRIMVEKAGLKIYELQRIRIGALTMGTLPEGSYRPLTEKERELLLQN